MKRIVFLMVVLLLTGCNTSSNGTQGVSATWHKLEKPVKVDDTTFFTYIAGNKARKEYYYRAEIYSTKETREVLSKYSHAEMSKYLQDNIGGMCEFPSYVKSLDEGWTYLISYHKQNQFAYSVADIKLEKEICDKWVSNPKKTAALDKSNHTKKSARDLPWQKLETPRTLTQHSSITHALTDANSKEQHYRVELVPHERNQASMGVHAHHTVKWDVFRELDNVCKDPIAIASFKDGWRYSYSLVAVDNNSKMISKVWFDKDDCDI